MGRKSSTSKNINRSVTRGARRVVLVARVIGQGVADTAVQARRTAGSTGTAARLNGKAGMLSGKRTSMGRKAGRLGFSTGRRIGRAEATAAKRPGRGGAVAAGALAGIAAAGAYAVRRRRNRDELSELNEAATVPVTVVEKQP